MDKRYQIFVSSTYEDLQEERREVMQALLELDCIPSGMELFPASNEDQWSLIKRVIDDSDYYIVIIGGRYGSTNAEGVSYTEMEYKYALETGKPIMAFLHKNPDEIKSKFTEKTQEGKDKLEDFRSLAEKKMVQYWTNASDLGSKVSRSMVKLMKQFPAVGWIKADSVIDENSMRQILELRKENEQIKARLELSKVTAPAGTEKLAQGEDEISITLRYTAESKDYKTTGFADNINITWSKLFAIVAPYLSIESDETTIKKAIIECLKDLSREDIPASHVGMRRFYNFDIPNDEFQNIKIQFKALGLISKSIKNRSVKDTSNYWTLTDYGDYVMTQLIAIKKEKVE